MNVDPREVVTPDDPRVDAYVRLTDMDLRQRIEPERGYFMAEGLLVIERCAAQGLRIGSVLTAPRWLERLGTVLARSDAEVLVAEETILEQITGYRVHRGALAAVERPATRSVQDVLSSRDDVLVLEDLVDPTNVGLAMRSAAVQGIEAVVLSPRCADPLYRRAVKASMGAVLRCRWARSDDWESTLAALAASRRTIALTPDGDGDLDSAMAEAIGMPVALMLGAEGPGLSGAALSRAWRRCRIPMEQPGDSLNVAAAAAIAAYVRRASHSMSA